MKILTEQVALIAPYSELAEITLDVIDSFRLPVSCQVGDLKAGVAAALEAIRSGVQVIVSRGGTALAIRQAWDGPVVEIPVSAYDVLRALHQAREKGRSIGVVGFPNVVLGTRDLGPMLGVQIEEVPLRQESDCQAAVLGLVRSGIEVVVGDHIAVKTAEEHGLPGVLVHSGKEAVLAGCLEALRVLDVRLEEQARTLRLRTILEVVGEGIIAVDAGGLVTLANPAAARILGRPETELMGKEIGLLVPDLDPRKHQGEQQGQIVRQGALQAAASFFPFPLADGKAGVVIALQEVQQLQRVESKVRKALLAKGHFAKTRLEEIVGQGPAMKVVMEQAHAFAGLHSVVLITGETGTGKELMAQGLHNASARPEGPFVTINCAALPESLLDSELFGYVEGAFTDARKGGKAGLFEQAHMGTIFLDEIGELPLSMQGRLLRVLQEREVMRIGDDRVMPVNVRVVAATNVDLTEAVRRGQFRSDLYYRINVLQLHLPPLRERLEDMGPLTDTLLTRLAARHRRPAPALTAGALLLLMSYRWPGNVRELENVMERLMAMVKGAQITEADVEAVGPKLTPLSASDRPTVPDQEQILSALQRSGQNRMQAATLLGMSRSTLWRRMRELGLQ